MFHTGQRVNILGSGGTLSAWAGRSVVGHQTCNNIKSRQSYLVVPGGAHRNRTWGPWVMRRDGDGAPVPGGMKATQGTLIV